MIKESFSLKGELTIRLFDRFGVLKEEHTVPNLVTTVGKSFVISRLRGVAAAIMSHMAIGSGVVAPSAGDTVLGNELGRVALSSDNAVDNTITYVAIFGPGVGTGAVTEAGVLNAAIGGTLLNRTTFAVVNKGAQDTMSITWAVTGN